MLTLRPFGSEAPNGCESDPRSPAAANRPCSGTSGAPAPFFLSPHDQAWSGALKLLSPISICELQSASPVGAFAGPARTRLPRSPPFLVVEKEQRLKGSPVLFCGTTTPLRALRGVPKRLALRNCDGALRRRAGRRGGSGRHPVQVGTPAFMAPEVINEGRLSPASDVYAFGVLLYEVCRCATPPPARARRQALWHE